MLYACPWSASRGRRGVLLRLQRPAPCARILPGHRRLEVRNPGGPRDLKAAKNGNGQPTGRGSLLTGSVRTRRRAQAMRGHLRL